MGLIGRMLALRKARSAGFEGDAEGIQVQVMDEITIQNEMLAALEGMGGQEEAIRDRRARLAELHTVQSALLRAFGGR